MNLKSEITSFGTFSFNFVEMNFFGKKIGVLGLLFNSEIVTMEVLSYFQAKGISPLYHSGKESMIDEIVNNISTISPIETSEDIDPEVKIQIQKDSEELDDFFNSLL